MRSCEAASELLSKYRNGHEVEQMVTNSFQKELRAEKIEDLGPSEAELEAERLRVRLFLLRRIEVGLFYYLRVSFYERFFKYYLDKFIYINVWFSDYSPILLS